MYAYMYFIVVLYNLQKDLVFESTYALSLPFQQLGWGSLYSSYLMDFAVNKTVWLDINTNKLQVFPIMPLSL